MNDFTLSVCKLLKPARMVKSCNFYSNQINDKINLLLPICTALPLTQRDFFFPNDLYTRLLKLPFVFPFHYPIHQPVLRQWQKKEAKFSMLCNSTVKQAMELIAKKNTGKQTKGIQEQQVILQQVNFHRSLSVSNEITMTVITTTTHTCSLCT